MSNQHPAGPILDGLGCKLTLDEGDFVTDALIIAKVVGEDGDVSLCMGTSNNLSWIDQNGLLTSAQQIIEAAEVREKGHGE